ncbi:MAG: FAD-binding oxidoreductase [Rhodobacteraceae bacterium]|nr:FAD-binding oxidoreductase [Paracoccaceae bacterium]
MALNPASEEFTALLADSVPAAALQLPADAFSLDLRGRFTGQDGFVIAPSDSDEVARIVRLCHQWQVPLVPVGGATGLVAGHLAQDLPRPVIVSSARMNRIRGISPGASIITAEAGCTLQSIQQAAASVGRIFPMALASKGSCHIGGNLATNSGGALTIKHGNMRDLCLGLEVVLPDGRIWNGLSGLRKDNQGYDVRNLLIGSEGTLGIITAASLRLTRPPVERIAALAAVRNPATARELLEFILDRFGDMLTAFELLSRTGFEFLAETGSNFHQPFSELPRWAVLIDIGSSCEFGLVDKFADDLSLAAEKSLIEDAVIADNAARIEKMWEMREAIPEANRRIGSVSSHDIAVPIESIAEFIAEADNSVAAIGEFRINCFGHMGDGNLHYNVFPLPGESSDRTARKRIMDSIHALVRSYGGSISAEHGTGRAKAAELKRYSDPAFFDTLRQIKSALDPIGIMNPGAVLEQALD